MKILVLNNLPTILSAKRFRATVYPSRNKLMPNNENFLNYGNFYFPEQLLGKIALFFFHLTTYFYVSFLNRVNAHVIFL